MSKAIYDSEKEASITCYSVVKALGVEMFKNIPVPCLCTKYTSSRNVRG